MSDDADADGYLIKLYVRLFELYLYIHVMLSSSFH